MAEVTSATRDSHLSSEEAAKYRALREQAEREKPQVLERLGKEGFGPASWEDLRELLVCVRLLREERHRQGLTCEDVARRAQLSLSEIESLEAESDLNPRLATLSRYAQILGHRLALVLAIRSSTPLPIVPTSTTASIVSSPSANV